MNTQSLVFFDKNGNSLNFGWSNNQNCYTGELLFEENGSDTFKTLTIYTFEEVDPFEFQLSGLTLDKFQLFNEHGFNFRTNPNTYSIVDKIESVNDNPNFYSKLIYGKNFDKLFPIGSEFIFVSKDSNILDFNINNKIYNVISTQPGAIMVLSQIKNSDFTTYNSNTSSITAISGINAIGIKNYSIGSSVSISTWSQPDFNQKLYHSIKDNNERVINVVNTKYNDGVYTSNHIYNDNIYNSWEINSNNIPIGNNFILEYDISTQSPYIYKHGGLSCSNDMIVLLGTTANNTIIPDFRSGYKIEIESHDPSNLFTISDLTIATFTNFGIGDLKKYSKGEQYSYNGIVYECVISYTQSATSSIYPDNSDYWNNKISYIKINEKLLSQSNIINGSIRLLSNKFIYTSSGNSASNITLNSFYNIYKNYLLNDYIIPSIITNNDLSSTLTLTSKFSDDYCDIKAYYNSITASNIISNKILRNEFVFGVNELLINEENTNYSKLTNKSIRFENIDKYGFLFTINSQKYHTAAELTYNNSSLNVSKTIENTILKFNQDYSYELYKLGILLSYTQSIFATSSCIDNLIFNTIFPNTPLELFVSTDKNNYQIIDFFYVEFFNIYKNLNITINGITYGVQSSTSSYTTVSPTLNNWISLYSNTLLNYGIVVNVNYNNLYFGKKHTTTNINIKIDCGKSSLPGEYFYNIVPINIQNTGSLITSNTIGLVSKDDDFSQSNLSSGMVVGINGSNQVLDNLEYNILQVTNNSIVLSYIGPFSGSSHSAPSFSNSPYKLDSFNSDSFIGLTSGIYITQSSTSSTTNVYQSGYPNQYGILDPLYNPIQGIWCKTRKFLRYPRDRYIGQPNTQYVWSWEQDNNPDIFIYDLSGNQLVNNGKLTYQGPKPLIDIHLNKTPNADITKIYDSSSQQTIFESVSYTLEYHDTEDLSKNTVALPVFLGYNSKNEGYSKSKLQLIYKENVDFTLKTNINNIITFENILDNYGNNIGKIRINYNSTLSFLFDKNNNPTCLKIGQNINIFINDTTNTNNKYISNNSGMSLNITEVYDKEIIVSYNDPMIFTNETTIVTNFPRLGSITYLSLQIKTIDKVIGSFDIYGQTEIEDIRYKTILDNLGNNINADDVFIFNEYDIKEQGYDWKYLNKKRKEMFMYKNEIFPYIGSYKAIINSIKYFGYNDLQLYEYYKNIDINSQEYGQLKKVEIPDIFDSSVVGWTELDYLINTYPNSKYDITNEFNLTYLITDKKGNNILKYSLDEVIIKLQGLKNWLDINVIPVTHKILDITGRADFLDPTYVKHKSYKTMILNTKQNMSPIDFKINEAYLMPINSGSSVYNVHFDFYTYSSIPDYYTLKIKTYQTFPEWYPFNIYNLGDMISYYNINYISTIDNNILNDPRKYANIATWSRTYDYKSTEFTKYNGRIYEFIGTQSALNYSYSTPLNTTMFITYSIWSDITKWEIVDLEPIQNINEFRLGSQLYPFNITVDSNIDPYVVCELTSDNNYGLIYTSKKNYEIRSILGLPIKKSNITYIASEPQPQSPYIYVQPEVLTSPTGSNTLNINILSGISDSIAFTKIDGIPGITSYILDPPISYSNSGIINIPNGIYTLKLFLNNCDNFYIMTATENVPINVLNKTLGNYVFTINATGSSNITVTLTPNIKLKNQYITFDSLHNITYTNKPNLFVSLSASSTSNLITSFSSSNILIADINGISYSKLDIYSSGTINITANQLGDSNYYPAYPVEQSLIIYKGSQTIIGDKSITKYIYDDPITLTNSNIDSNTNIPISGLPISYTMSSNNIATLTNNYLVFTQSGNINVEIIQMGDYRYNNYIYNLGSVYNIEISIIDVVPIINSILPIDSNLLINVTYSTNNFNYITFYYGTSSICNNAISFYNISTTYSLPLLSTENWYIKSNLTFLNNNTGGFSNIKNYINSPLYIYSGNNTTINTDSYINTSAIVSGGVPPYTINWSEETAVSGTTIIITNYDTLTPTFNGLTKNGNYNFNLDVTDTLGNTKYGMLSLIRTGGINNGFITNIEITSVDGSLYNGGPIYYSSTIILTANTYYGTSPYTYKWELVSGTWLKALSLIKKTLTLYSNNSGTIGDHEIKLTVTDFYGNIAIQNIIIKLES
jgi:hypothetical protein